MNKMKKIIVIAVAAIALTAAATVSRAADETVLEAFGASTGLALYNVQIIIGMSADAHGKSVYTIEETKNIIGEQKGALGVMKDYNDKLIDLSSIAEEDKDTLDEIYDCIVKLETLIDTFNGYLDNQTTEKADKFETQRQDSYSCIAALLGIDKK